MVLKFFFPLYLNCNCELKNYHYTFAVCVKEFKDIIADDVPLDVDSRAIFSLMGQYGDVLRANNRGTNETTGKCSWSIQLIDSSNKIPNVIPYGPHEISIFANSEIQCLFCKKTDHSSSRCDLNKSIQ